VQPHHKSPVPTHPHDKLRVLQVHPTLEPLGHLIDCLLDGVLVCSRDGVVVLTNKAAERIFRVPRAELLRPVSEYGSRFELYAGSERHPLIAATAFAGEVAPPVDLTVGSGAAAHYIRVSGSPARDEDGTVIGTIVVVVDITDSTLREAQVRRRLDLLGEIAAALSVARSPSQVAEVVTEQGMRATGADTCTLYVLDATRTALELIGERGVSPDVIDKIRRITGAPDNPTFASVKSGVSLWAENEDQYLALFPALATMQARGPRAKAFWSVPLIVEDRAVGLLGMGFYQPRRFSPDEQAFVQTFTKQCAQALLRATGLEREDHVRGWLVTTLRSIGDAVIATDTEGRVMFMNPVAERLTGWEEGEAQGRTLDDVFCIFSEETRAVVESPITKVLCEGTVVGLANHTVLRSRAGSQIPIADSGAPIRDASGKLLGVVLVFRDATAEKRERVRRDFLARVGEAFASSRDYRATLATVAQFAVPELADWCAVDLIEPGTTELQQVAVAHVDPLKVEFARELGQKYPPDPDAVRGAPQVVRTGKPELYAQIPAALIEAGARSAEHVRILQQLRLESAMVVPVRGRDLIFGAMTFVYADSGRRYAEDDLSFAEDFAHRAALAIENARALQQAEDGRARERVLRREAEMANRAKDDFLATVSHELRTPLNAILGWSVILRGRDPSPEVERASATIERNARSLTRLVEDVLDVSRIVSGKLSLTLGPTNIADAVDAALEAVKQAADAKAITITRQVGRDSLVIAADAGRVQQVMWNLLSNAVKFTPKRGAVSVHADRVGSDVCICVTDTGEGIAPEALPHVFEPFRQADASTTRRHGGLGLGLAIVKQLVAAHGGTVRAESDGEGRGAAFTVQLPARSAVPAVSNAARATATMVEASAASVEHQLARLDGLSVLVVDDEEDARTLVCEVLRERGADVHMAESTDEALEQFARLRPDVVVSDIGMPHADGYALIRRIRLLSVDKGGRTPAVALTAYARIEDAQRAFAAGYQSHVAKPVEPAQLALVVANLGGRSLD
jgi:PAS domain S-box-containing protein